MSSPPASRTTEPVMPVPARAPTAGLAELSPYVVPPAGTPDVAGNAAVIGQASQRATRLAAVASTLARKGFAMRPTAAGIQIVSLPSQRHNQLPPAPVPVTAQSSKDMQ